MATVTKGQIFGSTEQITNTKLHNLVDLATVTSIAVSDLSTGILGSLSSVPGQLRTISMVTSLASGAMIRHNGSGGWYASMT